MFITSQNEMAPMIKEIGKIMISYSTLLPVILITRSNLKPIFVRFKTLYVISPIIEHVLCIIIMISSKNISNV